MNPQTVAVRKGDGPHGAAFTKGATVRDSVAAITKMVAEGVADLAMSKFSQLRKVGPQPSATDSVSNLQTQMQVNYEAMLSDFVAMYGAPPVRVSNIRGEYFVWEDDEITEARARAIQPESPADRATDNRVLKSYNAVTYGLTRYVSDEETMNENSAVRSIARAVMFVYQACLQRLEEDFYNEVGLNTLAYNINGATGANTAPVLSAIANTTATHWSDHSVEFTAGTGVTVPASSPVRDVLFGSNAVHRNTGGTPQVLIVSPDVDMSLISHPQLVGRIDRGQTSGAAVPMPGDFERVLGVSNYVVGKGRSSTSDYFAGRNAWLLTAPPAKGVGDRSALMTALFGPEGNEMGVTIRTWYDEAAASTAIEGRLCYDIVTQDNKGGVRYGDIVA